MRKNNMQKKEDLSKRVPEGGFVPESQKKKFVRKHKQQNKKDSRNNHRKTIKIPEDTYSRLKTIKTMRGLKFDYRTIDELITFYAEKMNSDDKKVYDFISDKFSHPQ